MKRGLLIAFSAFAFVAFADDSYLYWMVGDSNDGSVTLGGQSYTDYSYARIAAVGSDNTVLGYLDLYNPAGGGSSNWAVQDHSTGGNGAFYANLAGFQNAASFYIEIANDTVVLGHSDGLQYADALAMATSFGTGTPANLWNMATFAPGPAPEPSSGLLLLFGLAGLALRRPKVQKA